MTTCAHSRVIAFAPARPFPEPAPVTAATPFPRIICSPSRTVAAGRDYGDVAPVRGVLRIVGGQKTEHAVDVIPVG